MRHLGTIYRKELLDTLRDRRTLMFMLLIPTVLTPLIILGATRFATAIQKEQAVQTVRVAANEESRRAYLELVHSWFLQTETAQGLKALKSPFLRVLIRPEKLAELDEVPAEILDDPEAFAAWTHKIAENARAELDDVGERLKDSGGGLTPEVREQAMEFYDVAVKGLGLIEFVDPAQLAEPPTSFEPGELPEDLAALPTIRRDTAAIASGDVHGVLTVPPTLERVRASDRASLELVFLHDSTQSLSGEAAGRIRRVADASRRAVLIERLERHGLGEDFLTPVKLKRDTDLASVGQRVVQQIGGILPYILLAFAFLGAIYPAIDLGAGEKERQTLETLLLSPASRTEIALGKFLVILTTSLCAASIGVLSLTLSVRYMVPVAILEYLDIQIEPRAWALVGLLVIPAAAVFSGVFLTVSILARSFKEAQSYLVPFQFVLILPAAAPLMPGLELSWKIAAIPLVNVSMLARECIKGDINWGYYALTLGSCSLLAGVCVALCVVMFRRESVLFRT
ncbi:MAG: sodium transport system permease protein [Candidatus Sumerlaeota bacterium]|nr:sodium transport system permease protein [Candidatus Sumerlaeota bacterium]